MCNFHKKPVFYKHPYQFGLPRLSTKQVKDQLELLCLAPDKTRLVKNIFQSHGTFVVAIEIYRNGTTCRNKFD